MQRLLVPAIAAVLLIGVCTYVEGVFTERWHDRPPSPEQEVFAERIKQIPTTVGQWDSADAPMDKREIEAARAVGHYSRSFYNKLDPSKVVSVLIICGHPTDITEHTPDKCYVASGFEEAGDQERTTVGYMGDAGQTAADFSTNRFHRGDARQGPRNLRVFWSFSIDGKWQAPSAPKVELRFYPAVVKLYAITEVPEGSKGQAEESAAIAFLQEFLPAANAVLFAAPDAKPKQAASSESVALTSADKPAAEKPSPESSPSTVPAPASKTN